MKAIRTRTSFTLLLVAGSIAMTLAVAAASTSSRRHGKLHVTKDCSEDTGQAGSFCTITSSNVPAIAVGAKVFYFQALIASTGVLDSNVVLDAGGGNRTVDRCTIDLGTNLALCTLFGRYGGAQRVPCSCRWLGELRRATIGTERASLLNNPMNVTMIR